MPTNAPDQNNVSFDFDQQRLIIIKMLEQAKEKSSDAVKALLAKTQKSLNDEPSKSVKRLIILTNLLVADLESHGEAKPTLDFLREKGFYRMMYRNPKFKGEELPKDDILHVLLRNGYIGVGISALLTAAFVVTMLVGAPFWIVAISSGLFIGSSVYLSGLIYGVVNDLFATHANLPYFLLGHQPQQKSLLRTNDKVAQGVAWGVAATFVPVVIAAILFTVVATITAFFVPMATFILPILMIAMPLIAVGAEFYARKKAKEHNEIYNNYIGSNNYQMEGLAFMSPNSADRAAWLANSDRNFFGFTKVPLIGLGGLIALVTLSAVSMFLPAVLIASPLIAVIVPAAFAALAVLALAIGGVFTYINRNRHVDDRNNLEFDREKINYDLYLDEDRDYALELLQEKKPALASDASLVTNTLDIHHARLFSPKAKSKEEELAEEQRPTFEV
jgi:hypothetical protein